MTTLPNLTFENTILSWVLTTNFNLVTLLKINYYKVKTTNKIYSYTNYFNKCNFINWNTEYLFHIVPHYC
jgi:hypothetical protein